MRPQNAECEQVIRMNKIYAFDDFALKSSGAVKLTPGKVEKLGVSFDSDGGLKNAQLGVFPCSIVQVKKNYYRMYYFSHTYDPPAMKIGVAHSGNGLNWEFEKLGQCFIDGKDTPYICIDGLEEGAMIIQPNVLLLPDGSWRLYCWLHGTKIRFISCESRDGLKWRVLNLDSPCLYHPNDEAVRSFASNYGMENLVSYNLNGMNKHKTMEQNAVRKIKSLLSNDATTVYYRPDLNQFELYSVWLLPNIKGSSRYVEYDNAPGIIRVIHKRTSSNGIDWSDPELIILPDADDPLDLQFYYLSVTHLKRWLVGFLGHYCCQKQTMDIELCFSRNGQAWNRPFKTLWIERGKEGEPDSKGIYPAANLIEVNDYFLQYYTGCSHLHNASLQKKPVHKSVMSVKICKDRFAGLNCSENTHGEILTRPFVFLKDEITINADISGEIRAEISDVFGNPLDGYGFSASVPLRGDSKTHVLRWKDKNTSQLFSKSIVVKLALDNATLYSIEH